MHPEGLNGYRSGGCNYPKVTVGEWVKFNQKLLNFDDVIVKVFRCRNLNVNNCCMTTQMKIADMDSVFGNYLIMHVGIDTYTSEFGYERSTLKFVIYKED